MSYAQVVTSLKGLFHWVRDPSESVDRAVSCKQSIVEKQSADAAGTDTLPPVVAFYDSRCTALVTRVSFVPDDSLTADDTDYATFAVYSRTAAGVASAGAVASGSTKTVGGGGSGDWTAFVPVSLTLNGTYTTLPAGGSLTLQMGKVGASGVEVPAGRFVVEYKEIA